MKWGNFNEFKSIRKLALMAEIHGNQQITLILIACRRRLEYNAAIHRTGTDHG